MEFVIESTSRDAFAAVVSYVDATAACRSVLAVGVDVRDPVASRIRTGALGTGVASWPCPETGDLHAIAYDVGDVTDTAEDDDTGAPFSVRKAVLRAESREVLTAFVNAAFEAYRESLRPDRAGAGTASLTWSPGRGAWTVAATAPARDPATLFLPAGVFESTLRDVRRFAAARERFERLGAGPVRVYLFHGPPGSGKTSLVRTVAGAIGHDVAALTFDPRMSSSDVVAAVRAVPDRAVLVVEDIDAAFEGRRARGAMDFSAMVAALDGAIRTRPLAVFLTTNHADRLDPALRRRVDRAVEFSSATREQCARMFAAFFADPGDFDAVWAAAGDAVGGRGFPTSLFHKLLMRLVVDDDSTSETRADAARRIATSLADGVVAPDTFAGVYA